MNKLLGFLELKNSMLPSIPWKEYTLETVLNDSILWTIRTAVFKGMDLNLPRYVGITKSEADLITNDLLKKFQNIGIVIYYPFFIAEKSGTLDISKDSAVIEAVKDDLWNLVTYNHVDVTIIQKDNTLNFIGDRNFMSDNEILEVLSYVERIRMLFRNYLLEGKNILLEWSYAYTSDINKNKIGNKYLIFYEARTI